MLAPYTGTALRCSAATGQRPPGPVAQRTTRPHRIVLLPIAIHQHLRLHHRVELLGRCQAILGPLGLASEGAFCIPPNWSHGRPTAATGPTSHLPNTAPDEFWDTSDFRCIRDRSEDRAADHSRCERTWGSSTSVACLCAGAIPGFCRPDSHAAGAAEEREGRSPAAGISASSGE